MVTLSLMWLHRSQLPPFLNFSQCHDPHLLLSKVGNNWMVPKSTWCGGGGVNVQSWGGGVVLWTCCETWDNCVPTALLELPWTWCATLLVFSNLSGSNPLWRLERLKLCIKCVASDGELLFIYIYIYSWSLKEKRNFLPYCQFHILN